MIAISTIRQVNSSKMPDLIMLRKKVLTLLFCIFFTSPMYAYTVSYIFDEETEGEHHKTIWNLEKTHDSYHVIFDNPFGTIRLVCSENYLITSLSKQSQNKMKYKMTLKGKTLTAEGDIEGTFTTKKIKLGKRPWVQQFGFGFKPFAISSDKSLVFYFINPTNFHPIKMIAKKEKIETLTIMGKEIKVQKIRITLTGFMSMFWHAEIWFNLENNSLVMYKSNEGPGTPVTTLTLIEVKQGDEAELGFCEEKHQSFPYRCIWIKNTF